jgi:hypothetical protein
MKDLFKSHYEAIKLRGLITPETSFHEFLNKADEELCEFADSKGDPNEAVDLICVMSNWLIHNGYDLEELLKDNLNVQLNRVMDLNYGK